MRRLLAASLLVATACGASPPTGDPGTTTTAPLESPTTSTAPSTTVTTAAPPAETTTTTTRPPPDGHPARAFGTATVTVDGAAIGVEFYACGWMVSPTDPIHPGPPYSGTVYSPAQGRSANFFAAATAPHGDDFFEIALTLREGTGTLSAVVITSESGDPIDSIVYSGGLLPASRLMVQDGRVDTTAPLRLRDVTGATVDVEFHGACDPMGGSAETSGQAAADIAGFTLPVATGTVVLDGVEFSVFATNQCVALDQGAEVRVEATSGTAELRIEIAANAQVQAMLIQSATGEVWQRLGGPGEFLSYAAGSVATKGVVTIAEALGAISDVEMSISCS